MLEQRTYLVEPMTLADIEQVMEIEKVAFPTPWSARAYRFEVSENEHSTMLVVRPAIVTNSPLERLVHRTLWRQNMARRLKLARPGPVLGYAGFWLLVDEAHICTIAVHPQWRGRGLGELLLLALIERGIELGANSATLEVRVSNRVAQELYTKYGFEIVSRRRGYYSDNNEDAYIMTTPPLETPGFRASLDRLRSQLYTRLEEQDSDIRTAPRGDPENPGQGEPQTASWLDKNPYIG
jgi:ribosomal-protein-alanine N-acetyltransferase